MQHFVSPQILDNLAIKQNLLNECGAVDFYYIVVGVFAILYSNGRIEHLPVHRYLVLLREFLFVKPSIANKRMLIVSPNRLLFIQSWQVSYCKQIGFPLYCHSQRHLTVCRFVYACPFLVASAFCLVFYLLCLYVALRSGISDIILGQEVAHYDVFLSEYHWKFVFRIFIADVGIVQIAVLHLASRHIAYDVCVETGCHLVIAIAVI